MSECREILPPPFSGEGLRDSLTNLPNRRWLSEYLPQLIDSSPGQFGLLFIDLDGLKEANDINGHAAGDELIKQTAEIASSQIRHWHPENPDRPPDSTARMTFRLGGDEFIIVMREIENENGLAIAKNRIQSALATKDIKASIGIAMHSSETAEELLELADSRMYEDKQRRKLASYTPEQREKILKLGDTAISNGISLRDLDAAYRAIKSNIS